MCGCAVELNMNSFIKARQKDTQNTDEAQARTHTLAQTHTNMHLVSVSSPSRFALSKTLLKTFPGGIFYIAGS